MGIKHEIPLDINFSSRLRYISNFHTGAAFRRLYILETIYLDKECRLRTLRVNESLNTLNISGIFGNQGGIADLFVPF